MPTPGANQVIYSGITYDTGGNILPLAVVNYTKVAGPFGAGMTYDNTPLTANADTNGYYAMAVQIGAGYQLQINGGPVSPTFWVGNANGQWPNWS